MVEKLVWIAVSKDLAPDLQPKPVAAVYCLTGVLVNAKLLKSVAKPVYVMVCANIPE